MADDISPSYGGTDVTPNDSTDLTTYARALYIGVGGNLKVTTLRGSTLTFIGVGSGSILPVAVRRVWATGTAASSIIALI